MERRPRLSVSEMTARMEPLEERVLLSAGLLITEFMAVNDGTLDDGDGVGNYPDWIEIHNPTNDTVSLEGWYLTDKADELDKWAFPDVAITPGQYMVVFASDQPVDDYVDAGGYLHTNFSLKSGGEYLALTVEEDSVVTPVHAYDPKYPRQVEDISFGLPDTGTVWEQLVADGSHVTYHVPTAGDAPLVPVEDLDPGWTGTTFDDSAWTSGITSDKSGVVITELAAGTRRFVEIQNVSDAAVDTSGWRLLVNNASSANVNAVTAEAWQLPAALGAGAVLYGADDPADATADFTWAAPLAWSADGPGWAMLIDDAGTVMDFAAWGYSAADIASLSIDFGAFTGITVGDQWSGPGVDISGGGTPGAEQDAIAFHSTWNYLHPTDGVDPAGSDPNFNTTWMKPTGYDGPAFSASGPATLAYGGVNFENPPRTLLTQPDNGKRYTAYFRGEFTLDANTVLAGIEIFNDDGAFIYIDGVEVARNNIAATKIDTYTTFADDHTYPDGVNVENATRTFAIPDMQAGTHTIAVSVHQVHTGSSDLGFDMRLYGRPVAGGQALRRVGDLDDDAASDFRAGDALTPGEQNPNLVAPFGTTTPTTTGVGFSDSQPAFDAIINTDLAADMQNVNASLWTRFNFETDNPLLFDVLTLHMKYDDGFVAYLNGFEVARRNAPTDLAYNSAALSPRNDALAVAFEDIDITPYLWALKSGPNVLAIHALNVSPGDSDLLLLPVLTAMSDLARPQYMTTPTPEGDNTAGALGLVADTAFSVDRGFYGDAFDVEVTTETPGAAIYYTLDSSVPTEATGTLYEGPIPITGQTVLRAAAFKPGYISSNVDTQTYVFIDDVIAQPKNPAGFPLNWASEPADHEMDPDVTTDPAYADIIDDALLALPTLSVALPVEDVFGPSGIWSNPSDKSRERAASAEMIYPDGTVGFQIDAGFKVQGGASRNVGSAVKHSLSLRFRDMYGESRLDYPLFADSDVDSFNSLQLRALYNNSWIHRDSGQRNRGVMMRDEWMRDTMIDMGYDDAGQGDFVHLYINGQYWGVYNVHERQDSSHYALYHDQYTDDTVDAIKNNAVIDGTKTSWDALQSLVANATAGGISLAEYQTISQKLDVTQLIDYMIVNQYGGNADWDHHNWRAAGGGTADAPWRMYSWDAERVLESATANVLGDNNTGAPSRLFQNLMASDEFKILLADRIHEHLHNDGALSQSEATERWMEWTDLLNVAIIGESARWGDDRAATPYTLNGHFLPEQQKVANTIIPTRAYEMVKDYRERSWFPTIDAATFRINGATQHGGDISAGALFSMPNASGTIYYTTDGTDPRAVGGGVAGTAYSSGQTIALTQATRIKARVRSAGGEWSAINDATFYVNPPAAGELTVTEINYNPYAPTAAELVIDPDFIASDFEFIELLNTTGHTVDLLDVTFAKGIDLTFTTTDPITLAAGQYAVVVANPAAFEARYGMGVDIAATFTGLLDNSGEGLALAHPLTPVIEAVKYNDSGAWPNRADGGGSTLELIDLAADHTSSDNWRSSSEYGGTPGRTGAGPQSDIVINEVLSHTDKPQVDAIELHNTTGAPVDVGGWFLSDTAEDYAKFPIPSPTIIPAGGFVVFYEGHYVGNTLAFNQATEFGGLGLKDFALDGAHGDDVWLTQADSGTLTRFADHVEFGASPNGESFGLWPDETGQLTPMQTVTLNDPNSEPRVGPLVISEIMYYPAVFHESFVTGQADEFNEVAGNWLVAASRYNATPAAPGAEAIALADIASALPADFVLRTEARATAPTGGRQANAFVIFDYQGPTDFKFAGLSVDDEQWQIGHRNASGWIVDASRWAWLGAEADYDITLRVTGSGATLEIDGAPSVTHDFAQVLTDGAVGLATSNSATSFASLAVEPAAQSDLEFVEIYNPTAQSVELASWQDNPHLPGQQYLANWRLRGGVDMSFDEGVTLGAGQTLVVLSFDPDTPANASRVAAFRAHYAIGSEVALAGGYDGSLSNGGDVVRLQRPDSPPLEETAFVPHTLEDEVAYTDLSPWPAQADGNGQSLNRIEADLWGPDPASWAPDAPTPGSVSLTESITLAGGSTHVASLLSTNVDTLVVSGAVTIDPNVTLDLIPAGGDMLFKAGTYTLIQAGAGLIGQFANVTALGAYVSVNGNGLTYNPAAGTLTLTLDMDLHPADGNLDGATDVSDRIIWNNNNFTEGTTFTTGDFNGDGATDVSDRIIWNNSNFTEAAPPAPIAQAAPAPVVLEALAAIAMEAPLAIAPDAVPADADASPTIVQTPSFDMPTPTSSPQSPSSTESTPPVAQSESDPTEAQLEPDLSSGLTNPLQ